jgi:hypothetical protein
MCAGETKCPRSNNLNRQHPKLTVMPHDTSPAKAQAISTQLGVNILQAISTLSGLDEMVEKLHAFTRDCDAWHHAPKGFDVDPIPGTPFKVVYNPKVDDEYHAILCRGVDVSDFVSSSVEEDAMNVVRDGCADHRADDGDRRRDEARDAKMEAAA